MSLLPQYPPNRIDASIWARLSCSAFFCNETRTNTPHGVFVRVHHLPHPFKHRKRAQTGAFLVVYSLLAPKGGAYKVRPLFSFFYFLFLMFYF